MIEVEVHDWRELSDSFVVLRDALKGSSAGIIVSVRSIGKKRTLSQNASLHLYCETISGKMNNAGFTQKELVGSFKEGFTLPVTMEMIKAIFREVGKAMFKKESTKDLTTIEIQEVYRVVDMRFAEITGGIRAEWPSVESQMEEATRK